MDDNLFKNGGTIQEAAGLTQWRVASDITQADQFSRCQRGPSADVAHTHSALKLQVVWLPLTYCLVRLINDQSYPSAFALASREANSSAAGCLSRVSIQRYLPEGSPTIDQS